MSRTTIHRLLAVVVASVLGGGVYWVTTDPLLSGSVALSWGVGAGVLLRIRRLYPGHFTGDGWSDGRWNALGIIVLGLAGFQGLRAIPVSNEYVLGLTLLVLGIYLVGYLVASIAEIERYEARANPTDSDVERSVTSPGDG